MSYTYKKSIKHEIIEGMANSARQVLGFGGSEVIEIDKLIGNIGILNGGIEIHSVSKKMECMGCAKLEVLNKFNASLQVGEKYGHRFKITYNRLYDTYWKRYIDKDSDMLFGIVHSLGYVLLTLLEESNGKGACRFNSFCGMILDGYREIDFGVRLFYLNFMLPRDNFIKYCDSILKEYEEVRDRDLIALANRYNVSKRTIVYRLGELGLIV